MRSLFRKTLEATGNGTLHFSCQTFAWLNGVFTASGETKIWRSPGRDVEGVPMMTEAATTAAAARTPPPPSFFSPVDYLSY